MNIGQGGRGVQSSAREDGHRQLSASHTSHAGMLQSAVQSQADAPGIALSAGRYANRISTSMRSASVASTELDAAVTLADLSRNMLTHSQFSEGMVVDNEERDLFTSLCQRLDDSLDALWVHAHVVPESDLDKRIRADFAAVEACRPLWGADSDFSKLITYKCTALEGLHAKGLATSYLRAGDAEMLSVMRKILVAKYWALSAEGDIMRELPRATRYNEDFNPNKLILAMQRLVAKIDERHPFLHYLQSTQVDVPDIENSINGYFLALQAQTQDLSDELPHASTYETARLNTMLDGLNFLQQEVHSELDGERMVHGPEGLEKDRYNFFQSLAVELSVCRNEVCSFLVAASAQEIVESLRRQPPEYGDSLMQKSQQLRWVLAQEQQIDALKELAPNDARTKFCLDPARRVFEQAVMFQCVALKMSIEAEASYFLAQSSLPNDEQAFLQDTVIDLPCLSPDELLSAVERASRLLILVDNMPLLFNALNRYALQIERCQHLSIAQKQDLMSWLTRLMDNRCALVLDSNASVQQFITLTDVVFDRMLSVKDLAERMARQVQNAAHNAACTDWAATALIDMVALAEGSNLEREFEVLSFAGKSGDEIQAAVSAFVSNHQTAFKRLLRYSAFRAFMQEVAAMDESIEMQLYLYRALQLEMDLPGGSVTNRMQYVDFTQRAFGAEGLQAQLTRAREALSEARILKQEEKLLLLDNLVLFDVDVWERVKAFLAKSEHQTTEGEGWTRSQCEESIQACVSRLNALDLEDENNLEVMAALRAQYNVWQSRLEAVATNSGPNKTLLGSVLQGLRPELEN